MKIWIVNQNAYTPEQSAGTRHYDIACALMNRGHDVTIIASSYYHKGRQETKLYHDKPYIHEIVREVPFLWLRTPPYRANSVSRLWNMLSFMRSVWVGSGCTLLGNPDVIVGSSPPLFGAFGALMRARRLAVPFVLEVRDLWPDSAVDLDVVGKRHPVVAFMRYFERRLYRGADKLITLLPESKPFFEARGVRSEDIVWIPNGVPESTLNSAVAGPGGEEGSSRHPFVLMYAGVHGHYSCLDLLLDAMKIVQEAERGEQIVLRMIGDGPLKPELVRRAQELQLRNVEFRDPVPKHQISCVLRTADAFVLVKKPASIYRWGFSPNKLFEYMAHAKPILFAGEMAHNYIEMADAGVTTRPSPADLASGIRRLAATGAERKVEMGRNARAYVESSHNIEVLADRFLVTLAGACGLDALPTRCRAL